MKKIKVFYRILKLLLKELFLPEYFKIKGGGAECTFHRLSLRKTLYINFKCLPFKKACRLPIFFYTNSKIIRVGKIEINSSHIIPGMIRWGRLISFKDFKTKLINDGVIIFNGFNDIFSGVFIHNEGKIQFGNESVIGGSVVISIRDYLIIGNNSRIGFCSWILDHNFHYSINKITWEVKREKEGIEIGNNNWFGNQTNVKKGTKTSDFVIVASANTLLTKDYRDLGKYIILGGIPARVIGKDVFRLQNQPIELEIKKFFNSNPKEESFFLKGDPEILFEECNKNGIIFNRWP